MHIRTLAGPPLPHELVVDTVRAIVLSDTIAAHGVRASTASPRLRTTVQPTRNR